MLVSLLIFGAMNMSHLVRTPIYGLIIVLTVGFSVLTSPLQARVQLDIIAKFRNADVELDVVTVVDSEVEASKSKVALLDYRFRESCHKQGIHLSFQAPMCAGALRTKD